MDEVLSECERVTGALKFQADLIALFASAGFPLRKWCSNHRRNLETTYYCTGNCSNTTVECGK